MTNYKELETVVKAEPLRVLKTLGYLDRIDYDIETNLITDKNNVYKVYLSLVQLNDLEETFNSKRRCYKVKERKEFDCVDYYYGNQNTWFSSSSFRTKLWRIEHAEEVKLEDFFTSIEDEKQLKITYHIGSDSYIKSDKLLKITNSYIILKDYNDKVAKYYKPKYYSNKVRINCSAVGKSYGYIELNNEVDYLDPHF